MTRFAIIDKNPKIIQQVRSIYEEHNEFHYVEIPFNNEEEILKQFLKYAPDLVFIDLDNTIKDIQGFFLDILQCFITLPVFVGMSSTKEKAFEAFQYEMFGFLLKPLSELGIRRNMMKCRKKINYNTENIICLKSHKDYHYIAIDDILYLEADNNSTDFYLCSGKKVCAYKTLKRFEKELPGNFLRIHRSYIINSCYVSRINYTKSICSLKDICDKIPFTKTFIYNIDKINENLILKTHYVF